MRLSTHYYVISLGLRTNSLFEAFRDTLIDIHNKGFPVDISKPATDSSGAQNQDEQLRERLRAVEERFSYYYGLEPLPLVVTGEKTLQTAFASATDHGAAIVGRVDGDYSTASPRDLGRIVWPVVKEVMSGVRETALHDLETAADARKIYGLEAVGQQLHETEGGTLLVENGYHVRGSLSEADGSVTVLPEVDVRDEIDDVVDMIIEKVLKTGGKVVFMPDGSLSALDRIVLLLDEEENAP